MDNFKQSKLGNVLSALNPKEWKQLKVFLQSGLSGSSGYSVDYYDYLTSFYPEFTDPQLSKKSIFDHFF